MATTKEDIHRIVDRLSDDQAEAVLGYVNGVLGPEAPLGRERKAGTVLVSGRTFFTAPPRTWQELAAEQGVSPVGSADELVGDFWPEDESVDDFLAAVREWRRDG